MERIQIYFLTCIFDELPDEIVVDASSKTSLEDENLLNSNGDLEIKNFQMFICKTKTGDEIICNHPTDDNYRSVIVKQADLKKRAVDLGIDEDSYDKRSNVSFDRRFIF
ncbi:hypothetical protein HGP05_00310 [Streptococcus sanguinis]|uniref:Uncharacterized protein n=1 Tax=Streptococcus sanguinis TaxID=1305 RepID=A0A7Y0VB13_STRSA|nr:hypothetical protein [Streptococcus sanguinis]